MRLNETHSQVLMELALIITRPISIICKKPWQSGGVLGNWKRANHSHLQEGQKGGSVKLRASQPHLGPWEGEGSNPSASHLQT